MKIVTGLNDSDRELVKQYLEDFVPREILDIHAHAFKAEHFKAGAFGWLSEHRELGCADHRAALGRYLSGRTIHGVYAGMPKAGVDRPAMNRWVSEEVKRNGTRLSRPLMVVSPEDHPEEVAARMREPGFVGIKVYHCYSLAKESFQATLDQYAPEWMWKRCHEMRGILMVHLVRDKAVSDEGNLQVIRRLARAYPHCQLILAHAARGFNYRNLRPGLLRLVDLDNVWVDTAAVTEMEALREAIRILGPRRVLYGSDYAVSELRGRCVTTGDSFFWLYREVIRPEYTPPTTTRMTLVGIESLICLREACEECGLGSADVRDIFLNNALRLLAPHLDAESRPQDALVSELWSRSKNRISCGTGLMSKRAEQFDPSTWPAYFSRCLGCEVWDLNGKRYVDLAGGVGAILLGYADPDVSRAVRRRLDAGTYCTLVSPDEVELADLLLELHPWAGRVRYARGGGEAMTVAVRIARAATGRSGIAFCGYHGWQDWYLAANLGDSSSLDGHLLPGLQPLGVPRELQGTSVPFRYNDWASFEEAMRRLDGKLAAVVMEPMRSQWPKDGFLEKVAQRCRTAGGVYIVDEITSGWRFGFPGALSRLGVPPDVAVYAKAMSNGFPCAAVVGKAEIMDAANASFISSSYWTDGVGTTAALACIRKLRAQNVQAHVWELGERLKAELEALSQKHSSLRLKVGGMPCSPSLAFDLGPASAAAKVLMVRKMLSRGYLMSSQLYVMRAHRQEQVDAMLDHLGQVLEEIKVLNDSQRLAAEAGPQTSGGGFARLA